MMTIKLLTSMASADGRTWAYGEIIEVDDDLAMRLIETGQAEFLPDFSQNQPKKSKQSK